MREFWVLVLLALSKAYYHSNGIHASQSERPEAVRIGLILAFDTVIGKVAKIAIEAAVEDVNSNPDVLKGTKLEISMIDSHFSGFIGIFEAIRFMETETVAIIGPQSSVTAHSLSYIANELHVPLLSFSTTDPTLSPLQFPYFIRTSVNDLFQMTAIADIIKYYGWRDVIVIYVDDDYGRNGIFVLSDQLTARNCRISYKVPLKPDSNFSDIRDALVHVTLAASRIFIVHTYPEGGLDIMATAQYLGMLEKGYVWIATNWHSTILDSNIPFLSQEERKNIQGMISLRIYTPVSEVKEHFVSTWKNRSNRSVGLNTYGLYAYDTVWLLSHAIDDFLDHGGKISFTKDSRLENFNKGTLHLNTMSIFNGGSLLLDSILNVNMTGLTGRFQLDSDRNLFNPAFEIINVIGTGFKRIGYWTNYSGLSVLPPEKVYTRPSNRSSSNQELYPVIWPGQTVDIPRGWVFSNNGRQLRFGVPNRVSFRDFVAYKPDNDMYTGFCIEVFTAAINLLPYAVPYKLNAYGDGHSNPSGTELVRLITTGVYDAAVGDIAIITNRTRMVDFTQPYIESGLVVVAPVTKLHPNAWAFLQPFSREMWCVTGVFFIIIGSVVWISEHRINDEFRGPPRKQVVTILWFSISTLFFAHRENTISTLGRFVLLLWLFLVLIINSSYTASLTSIFTVHQLSSPIKGLETLLKNNDPIGYQHGSFARDYLVEELGIHESRLVSLKLPEDYAKALNEGPKRGGVAAIIDERAYVELFLSTRCEFSITGSEFTRNGWGFAFPKDSPLAEDMSTAILKLSETGDLQRIHDKWLSRSACSSQGTKLKVENGQLELTSFEGLFLICGLTCLVALIIHFIKMVHQFIRYYSYSGESSQSDRLQTFFSFVDEKEESIKARSKRMEPECASSNRNMN